VSKIIINDALGILVISNHNSFRVLFDKIASVYILFEKYINILALEMASPGNRHCANCIGTFSFPIQQHILRDCVCVVFLWPSVQPELSPQNTTAAVITPATAATTPVVKLNTLLLRPFI